MGAGSCQPLAKRKGVHREVESEGSVMSKVPARGTRTVLGIRNGMSLLLKTKSNKLHGHEDVDMAGIWDESYASYRGRSHGRMKQMCKMRLKQDLP
ncbi:MAG TPA: hypothetical protein DEH07_10560 [Desulfotomaculum sp.]|nr:MAG: Uncharacterized protein XD84_1468 [Desulfotomaculum sp. 46_80]HBY04936.1 hypothetical protein [Desulfotomaculum sp.]